MASIELRTPKNKPAYYKIIASITLNGQTIRKFSRFDFDPKTLRIAKQRTAATTVATFEFETKAQEEAERSINGSWLWHFFLYRHEMLQRRGSHAKNGRSGFQYSRCFCTQCVPF